MSDRPQDDSPPRDDRTRDITLPPLPDRPPPALPKEWADLEPPDVDAPTLRALPGEDPRLHDQPTDKVGSPRVRIRPPERTIAFSAPEMVQRPVHPVQVDRTPRRWPWVVLTVVPLLVIAGAGVALLLLLR
ncbi:hypothetical protein [Blastococcus sp. PRF04-17]|uniref:hypothetical protein n=1 Tax=Blastococcus sp. PRF04-17 TaxID=2933797 RepID=UPI001FF65071|nr:hypothetical protein [Blastococcus sp. PRF04-17]UOY03259.1 hypothetical protein MVA48_07920 [Blastococcus sp. PRF04-17]